MEEWSEKQLTEEECLKLGENKFWEGMTKKERFEFQLYQRRLCMPFNIFHEAAEVALGRPVFTHEFAYHGHMVREYLKEKPAPTLEEIINLIPKEKRVLITK